MTWAEEDWERITPYVSLTLDDARAMLTDVGEPMGIELLTGGKANTNYKATFDDRPPVVLRVYERDKDALEREARLLDQVDEAVPAPQLLARTTTHDGSPVGVFGLLPGRHPSEVEMDDSSAESVGRALGRTLAALSRFEYPQPGLFAPDLTLERRFEGVADSFVDLIEWSFREGRAGERLGPELRSSLTARLDGAARLLEVLEGRYSLVHGDYKFSNILVDERADGWHVSGLLDWEFACPFTPMLDIAILMRHRETFPPALVAGFARAYSENAPLPDDWERLSRVVDLMNLVGFLNAPGDRPRLFEDVRGLVVETLELIE